MRVWVIEIIGIEIILHFIFAGSALLIMLPIMRSISGDEGIISLAGLMLASQLLFILLVPKLVDLMMGTDHVYRPGSPNTVWAAQCLPWLLFLGVLVIKKYSSFDSPSIAILIFGLSVQTNRSITTDIITEITDSASFDDIQRYYSNDDIPCLLHSLA